MIRLLLIERPKTAHMQFMRYFFVGGTAAVVDLLVYTVLLKYAGFHYASAAFVGYMLGLAWNHLLCIYWVFESKHHRSKEVMMVFLIALGGLLWTWGILYALISLFGVDEVIAKMISQIIVLLWNFGMRKVYVFH
ncbi:GtrA family protein [Candidatus Peregrinibacteria bacterium]|nr:GtrA family protein [Candidatus Peregrinibacteria bacterium]